VRDLHPACKDVGSDLSIDLFGHGADDRAAARAGSDVKPDPCELADIVSDYMAPRIQAQMLDHPLGQFEGVLG